MHTENVKYRKLLRNRVIVQTRNRANLTTL